MKKLLFIIMILFASMAFAQQDTLVNDFISKTTIGATDIVPFQITSGGNWYWRKMIGSNFWAQTRDTTQAQLTTLLSGANSWTARQTFSGATFGLASFGQVTFADSVLFAGGVYGSVSFYGNVGFNGTVNVETYRTIFNEPTFDYSNGLDSLEIIYLDCSSTDAAVYYTPIRFVYEKRAADDSLALSFEIAIDTVGAPDVTAEITFGTIGAGSSWGSVSASNKVLSGSLWSGTDNTYADWTVYLDVSGWTDGIYPMAVFVSGTPETQGTMEVFVRRVNVDVIGHAATY